MSEIAVEVEKLFGSERLAVPVTATAARPGLLPDPPAVEFDSVSVGDNGQAHSSAEQQRSRAAEDRQYLPRRRHRDRSQCSPSGPALPGAGCIRGGDARIHPARGRPPGRSPHHNSPGGSGQCGGGGRAESGLAAAAVVSPLPEVGLDFGRLETGRRSSATVTVLNHGRASLEVSGFELSGESFSVSFRQGYADAGTGRTR